MIFCTCATRGLRRMGRALMLVLCSRNARPEKGLVRRPQVDQHGYPSQEREREQAWKITLVGRRWLFGPSSKGRPWPLPS